MKKLSKIISVLLAAVMLLCVTACEKNVGIDGHENQAQDFASVLA